MEFEKKAKRWEDLWQDKQKIIESFRGREKISFSELVELMKIERTKKGELHKGRLFSFSNHIRDLIKRRIMKDSTEGNFRMSETFTLTDYGRELLLSEEDKLKMNLKRLKNSLQHEQEYLIRTKKEISDIENKLKKVAKT